MAKFKLPNLKFFSGTDAKSRIFMVVAAVGIIGLLVYVIISYFGGESSTSGPTRVATAPALQTVPGSQLTPEYNRAVMEANEQAARQAQVTGTSAVPILTNVPNQSSEVTGFGDQNCTILCPGDDNANVADDIAKFIQQGKLSQEDGARLVALANSNVPVEEYAAALDELVRQGKLTPEQARILLDKYKKQHGNVLLKESGAAMDALIKSGRLPLDTANQLLALQKRDLTPDQYAAELNRLVREGKLTPEAAAQLLAQYTQQKMKEQAKKGAFALQQMARAGQITPDVAKHLADLQAKGLSVNDYEAELNRLVAAGKMTPEAAAKLLEQYKKQRAGIGAADALNAVVRQEEAKAAGVLSDLVKGGKLSAQAADALSALQKKNASPQEYEAALNQLVKDGKLSPDDAKKLGASYQKLAGVRGVAQRLAALQGNNASPAQYADELKQAVQKGLITPETATALYDQYRSLLAAATAPTEGGIAPGVDTSLPAGAAFAQLQEQLQTTTPTAPAPQENVQFTAPPVGPPPISAEQQAAEMDARRQRLEQLQANMSSQADKLVNAWQPATMVHKDGAPPEKTALTGDEKASGKSASEKSGQGTSTESSGATLIKAGTILFAILDTAVNSDYPDTPVMATIVQGPLKGAKLLGKLSLAQGQDRVSLNFTLMDKEGWSSSKSISAFAIDPDTARTVMASSVDYHYMKRYGAIMATSFLQGYSSAVTNAGTATTGIFGTSTTHPALSPGNKFAVGLGQIGTTMSNQVSSYINTPATVKVNSGVGLGILFMGELKE